MLTMKNENKKMCKYLIAALNDCTNKVYRNEKKKTSQFLDNAD